MKKQVLLLLVALSFVFVSLSFVFATELNSTYLLSFGNFSSTLNAYCNVTWEFNTTANDYNVTIYYNASGGAAGTSTTTGPTALESVGTALTTIANTSSAQYEFYSAAVDISGLTQGYATYNFSCMADNTTDQIWSDGAENITLIHNGANINVTGLLIFNDTLDEHNDYGNFSANFSSNVTVNITVGGVSLDEFGYLDSVYFNLSKSGEQMFFESSHGGDTLPFTTFAGFNQTIDTLNGSFSDAYQVYSLCIYANDSLGNINFTECFSTLTIDNNAPAPTLTKASSTTGSITLTIAPGESGAGLSGDCSSNRGTLSALSVTEASLNCGTSYSYTVTCTDYMNLAGSVTTSFSTSDCSGNAAGGGGTTVTGKTYSTTSDQLATGYTKSVSANDQIKFTIETESHSVKATSVSATSVTITVASTPQTATLATGETKKFDLDGDGLNDLSVTLNSITSGKADLTLKTIEKAVAEQEKAEEEAAAEEAATEEAAAKAKTTWIWIVIIIVIIVVVVGYFLMKKRR